MRLQNVCCMAIVLAVVFAGQSYALQLSGNERNATADPNAMPESEVQNFAISDNVICWVDWRDQMNYQPQVFATLVNDPTGAEYLIDSDTLNAWGIAASGNNIAYNAMDPMTEENLVRVANVDDIENPVLTDVNVGSSYILDVDIDGDTVAFVTDYDYYSGTPQQIFTFSSSDPAREVYNIHNFDQGADYLYTNISLYGNKICWSGYYVEEYNEYYYLGIADITDPNNAVVTRTAFPASMSEEDKVYTELYTLDTSSDWLIANGMLVGQSGVFAIGNYTDPNSNNWQVVDVFVPGGWSYQFSEPRIWNDIAVWTSDYYSEVGYVVNEETVVISEPPSSETRATSGGLSGNRLMGALLLDNGRAVVSTLKINPDTEDGSYYRGADISGGNVLWSFEGYDPETYEYTVDLFTDGIGVVCGDWGYSLADMNHDCNVDLIDVAMVAERWLDCTLPDSVGCIYGEVYPTADGLWEVVMD